MILCRGIYGRSYEGNGISAACFYVIRAAADLKSTLVSAVNGADVYVRIGNKLAGLYLAYDNPRNILAKLDKLFNLKAYRKQKSLKFLCGNVYINIILKPTKRC